MIEDFNRRGFIKAGATLVLASGLPKQARAQSREKLLWVMSTSTYEVGTATQTSIPYAAGFFDDERLDVELKSARGSALGAQMIMSGQGDVAHAGTSAGLMAPVSKGASLVAFYNMITQNFQAPAVPVESSIKSLTDLKGAKIGIIGKPAAMGGFVKALLQDAGVDPNKDVSFINVGFGVQAATPLWITKQIDALAMYDSAYAAIESVSPDRYALRRLSSPLSEQISFQTALIANAETLKSRRDALVRLARAHAKSTIFALENPEAAVRIHFRRYPEQRPTGISESAAVALGKRSLLARLNSMRIDTMALKRDKWGLMQSADVAIYANVLKKIGEVAANLDLKTLYTNDLIDEINRFDTAEVRKRAREFKL